MATVEVEGIKKQGEFLDKVVVGELVEIKKHPNADKLSIAQIDVGEKKPRQVVFGEMVEIKKGYRVPVALAPTKLPGDVRIKKTNFRGVKSEGMLCLDQELGLLEEGVSIHFFNKNIKPGTPIAKALNLDDTIIEIENKSLTNRPDLWSHYGIAREVAALLKSKVKSLRQRRISLWLIKSKVESKVESIDKLKVEIRDNQKCPRYLGVVIDNIKIQPSPAWMTKQLEAVGVRAINNIVDITNYVLMELGQPLHAFDYRKLANQSRIKTRESVANIIIRCVKQGEKIITLDGVERELTADDLVIADPKKPVALAGVMGGANSEINDKTTKIIIESANFEASGIRRTETRTGLRTEASIRFEKSLDPELAEQGIKRAIELILELCPSARVTSPIVDVGTYKPKKDVITLDLNHLNCLVGEEIPAVRVIEILKSLEFKVTKHETRNTTRTLHVEIPSFRATRDVTIQEDLIEEVSRIYGYENIKPQMPSVKLEAPHVNTEGQLERQVKNILTTGFGFNEVQNYSFVDSGLARHFGYREKDLIALDNPITPDQSHLRPNLLINLCKNIKDNLRFFDSFKLFEIGRVFTKEKGSFNTSVGSKSSSGGSPAGREMLPKQEKYLSGVVVGKDVFEQAKALVENLLEKIGAEIQLCPGLPRAESRGQRSEKPMASVAWADTDRILEVKSNNQTLGYIAELSSRLRTALKLKSRVGAFEINFSELAALPKFQVKEFEELPIYPSITRDLAIIVSQGIMYQDIAELINGTNPLIIEVNLFDVYTGKNIGEGKRSLAFHIIFQAPDKTLESEEVDKIFEKVVKKLEEKFEAKIRA